jgi:RNA polymerase sigma-70 factor (ECF subfamily)
MIFPSDGRHGALRFEKVDVSKKRTRRSDKQIGGAFCGHGTDVPGLDLTIALYSEPLATRVSSLTSLPAGGTDEARLRLLMEQHYDFVWRSLRRLGLGTADADDGTQEAFLVASRKLSSIEPGCERRYLFVSALKIASTRRRSLRRRKEAAIDDLEGDSFVERVQAREPGPEQQAELAQARRQLELILDAMDLDQRAVFILYELEELTAPEIAATLSVPLGTVSTRLRAARQKFEAATRRLQARDGGGR